MRKQERKEWNHIRRMEYYRSLDTNGKLIINLRDLSHTMRALYEGRGSQKRILIILNETGTITQRALTERLGIQPGSASEIIAKLEKAGLIERTPSAEDRRTVDIALTESGRETAAAAAEQRNHRHAEMFSCLSESEKAELLSLLEKVNEDWSARYQDIGKEHDGHHRHGGDHPEHGGDYHRHVEEQRG